MAYLREQTPSKPGAIDAGQVLCAFEMGISETPPADELAFVYRPKLGFPRREPVYR